jgi:nucleoside-diphosphate kinase
MERSLILLKPDAVQRGLIGTLISRIEGRGLKIIGLKLIKMGDELASKHYQAHFDKPFYKGLVSFITSGPIICIAVESNNAIALIRNSMGSTNPVDSLPGTIRGDLAIDIGRNLIHGSDSAEEGLREVNLFFLPDELVSYSLSNDSWITEPQ